MENEFKGLIRGSAEPIGGYTRKDIWKIHDSVKIGDRIKYRTTEGYTTDIDDNDSPKHFKRGTVIIKEPYYCVVVDHLGIREAVLWLDVVRNGGDF